MTKKAGFWIFLLGTLSSAALFLGLTWDMHRQVDILSRADKLSDTVVAGKKAFEKHNCNDCHTILGFGGYYAPDLTRVVQRVGEDGVRYRIKHPELAFAASKRKMPQQNISDADTENLLSFFKWVGEIDNGDWPPQDSKKRLTRGEKRMAATAGISPGAAVFQTRGCMTCHALRGAGGSFGPALDTIGRTLTAKQMEHYIKDPKSMNPKAMMPPQTDLTDRELEEVAKFLGNLK
jgi:nitric oxide reductase subunit C